MAVIISERCSGCGACVSACPFAALTLLTDQPRGRGKKRAVVDPCLCCNCGGCIDQCPLNAINLTLK
ncbi:4Fe-4S binding protein [Pelobacter sp. M08fum]|uniref:4Fe-4S binding protein n=2 Tax=Pelovirga terrestris TaxID=2771352 RepID=A0A8J6UGM3_9BACT|nr:4Fe-4S binding protein [Pelovirga terrestris]